ncbi:MAG: TIM barrel protein [Bacteroidota bacterium]|nr:TIM barrel protein [Bacteroidota bacterium]
MIKIGPSGLGPVKQAEKFIEKLQKNRLTACEITFTYGIYIKKEIDRKNIGKKAESAGISLSIHAPYWINLNSAEKDKRKKSKERILNSCRAGTDLGATHVVFHPGYYGDASEKDTYDIIREQIEDMENIRQKEGLKPLLAPETTGKINVFGSVEETAALAKDTGCSFTIDFAHILAREKHVDYKKLNNMFPQKHWHCHYSGIEYGEKGEKKHLKTSDKLWKTLFDNLTQYVPDKNFTFICESPEPFTDAIKGYKVLKSK